MSDNYGAVTINEPDILGAVYDFLLARVAPAIDPDHILRGWQNGMTLPSGDVGPHGEDDYVGPHGEDDYVLLAEMERTRVGTNVRDYEDGSTDGSDADPGAGRMVLREYRRCAVRLDFCSPAVDPSGQRAARALQRASCVETLARDEVGAAFFARYGIGCLYADGPQGPDGDGENPATVDSAGNFAPRYRITLHLGYWATVSVHIDSFNAVRVGIENVDAHHKPV